MKTFKKIMISIVALAFIAGCNEGIDPISQVNPGTDATAPVIKIISPAPGYEIKVPDLISTVDVKIEVTDDIELKSVSIKMDGKEFAKFNEFKDYRRLLADTVYKEVANGDHSVTVEATDLQGKVSTQTVNFAKVSPYNKVFPNEIFYMPFEGDYMEMISFKNATKVGSPTFVTGGIQNSQAYMGAKDSYLTFPIENLKYQEFTAAFWYKVNATPDRSGILNVSPPGEDRTHGFRLFREGGSAKQRIKLNVGTGTGETWNDGMEINAPSIDWVHIAFTVSSTSAIIYVNGSVAMNVANTGIDWTNCTSLTIGSGAPNFVYWDHKSDLSQYDELRFFDKALTANEIQDIINHDKPYVPKYGGEVFYMPFDGNYKEMNSKIEATKMGTPDFADGKKGKAYAGAADSYLTFPTTGLKNNEFSAVFWTKINAAPDRAGILIMGPEDKGNASYPTVQNNRKSGFRFFREGSATAQIFKLNAGNGTADSWFDGGATATINPTAGKWVHMAFTISATECVVYFDGEVVKQGSFGGINWDGCDILSIMSGAPRFTEWNHLSDLSLMDELRIFNKALTQAEIKTIFNNEK
ncbi:MAG TPA: LamG domain-containing protein [Draconibacterium sp.]|nr:LamG domain-containing protein [Draconibacterium sp.]